MRTRLTPQNYLVAKSIAFGAIGGFVGGLAMVPFFMLTSIMVGIPADTTIVARGLTVDASQDDYDNAVRIVGFGMHMLTSSLIGAIFGAVIAVVRKLRITTFRKGIGEGLVTGIIAFAILFVPIYLFMMQPALVQLMMRLDPSLTTQQQAMNMLQQEMPMIMGMAVIYHLVYGAVLGAVTSVLVLNVRGVRRGVKEK